MIKVAPSILAADFANLERDVHIMEKAGADLVHIDVMDGSFVPNITVGLPVVSALRKVTQLPLDVHLMLDKPIRYAKRFIQAGADNLTIHVEADTPEQTAQCLRLIRENGCRASLSLKPGTPAQAALPYLSMCDMILVMTVEPGFGGQSFQMGMLRKLEVLRQWLEKENPQCLLQVDGGVNTETCALCCRSGANVLVTGSAFFRAPDRESYVRTLKGERLPGKSIKP